MAYQAVPLSILAKNLESSSGYDFQVILKTITSELYVDDKLLKSELAVFVAKILKLLRSSDDFQVWKGCHLTNVLCAYNPLVLCSQAGTILTAIFNKLEQKAGYYRTTVSNPQGRVLLKNLVKSVGIIIELVRGKPALTREVLTPRLSAIIGVLVTLSQFEPSLCCPITKKLLLRNTTTFKPHVNKFRAVLVNLIVKDYHHFDAATRKLIADNFALLNLVKHNNAVKDDTKSHHKLYQDEQWRQGLLAVLYSFKPIISLCGEIVDFSADSDMQKLVQMLPSPQGGKIDELLPALDVDLNKPATLWSIAERLKTLCDLTSAFISQPTHFPIRVPLGALVNISEALLSLTTNYLPLQRTLRRDLELTSTVSTVLPKLQSCGMDLLHQLSKTFGMSMLPYTPSILSSLELFIPMRKGCNLVDFDRIDSLKDEFYTLLVVTSGYMSFLGISVGETTLFTKLVDVALYLAGDHTLLKNLFLDQNARKPSEKSKKASKQNAGSMSDVFSHSAAFTTACSKRNIDMLNCFFVDVITHLKLPSIQQNKISKYCITNSLKQKRESGKLPDSFVLLIRGLVMHPGFDRASILPIAVSLLKEEGDDVFNVFCNPRLPFGSVQLLRQVEKPEAEEFDTRMGEEPGQHYQYPQEVKDDSKLGISTVIDNQETSTKVQNGVISSFDKMTAIETSENTSKEEPGMILRKRSIDTEVHEDGSELKIQKTDRVELETLHVPTVEENENASAADAKDGDEEDSDFEIPHIDLSEDDED